MAKTQSKPLSGAKQTDDESFRATLQFNYEELFEAAHEHRVVTTVPAEADGQVGDIVVYDDGAGVTRLYVKFPSGWKSATFA